MIKVMQYIHGTNVMPACVSAWSIRKFGGLPKDTRYILYTTTPENFQNPLVNKVFDEIAEPTCDWRKIWNLDWTVRPEPYYRKWNSTYTSDRQRMCFIKYVQWLEEPCDEGDFVIFSDYDTLCVGDLRESFPVEPEKLWSGYPYRMKYRNWAGSTNGGFYVKNGLFQRSELPWRLQESLWDVDKYTEAFYNFCPHNDESAVAYFLNHHGDSTLKKLDTRFNHSANTHPRLLKTIEELDVRVLHYLGDKKPWFPLQKPFIRVCERWRNVRHGMMLELR